MDVLGIPLAEALLLIGVIGLIASFIGVEIKQLTKPGQYLISIALLIVGAYMGGYLDGIIGTTGGDDADTGGTWDTIVEGITLEVPLRNYEDSTAITSKTVGLYEAGTTLLEIQSADATPLQSVTTDANGIASFAGLDKGTYVAAYSDDETAFDGTHYMAAAQTVEVRPVSVLESDETVTSKSLKVKKLGDAFYTITATSGSNPSSGGVDADATITEAGSAGTTVHVTLSCATDKAWLTDPAYYQRVYLSDEWTDNGGTNTAITLADCRMNASGGKNILKDSSATYYVDVTSNVMQNTTKSLNQTFTFTIWIPDLGTVNTTADTYAITFKHTLIRADTTNQTILQDAGHKITVTQA